ncbi:hypothetical protein [Nocardia altamirensis]|uniref:hypothetical protein n=1 Tax=Nocardia altamirensis TaxID=472158 RepID=UPI00114CF91B|nr:hypothetical protein [Nocardia altamirensis]
MPRSSQSFTTTELFHYYNPILEASGPVNGPICVGYHRPGKNRHSRGSWVLVIVFSPRPIDSTGHPYGEQRYVTVGKATYSGYIEMTVEPEQGEQPPFGTFGERRIARHDAHFDSFGVIPQALQRVSKQILTYYHTPQRLHAAKIDHTAHEIVLLDRKILERTNSLIARRAATLQEYARLVGGDEHEATPSPDVVPAGVAASPDSLLEQFQECVRRLDSMAKAHTDRDSYTTAAYWDDRADDLERALGLARSLTDSAGSGRLPTLWHPLGVPISTTTHCT